MIAEVAIHGLAIIADRVVVDDDVGVRRVIFPKAWLRINHGYHIRASSSPSRRRSMGS